MLSLDLSSKTSPVRVRGRHRKDETWKNKDTASTSMHQQLCNRGLVVYPHLNPAESIRNRYRATSVIPDASQVICQLLGGPFLEQRSLGAYGSIRPGQHGGSGRHGGW